MLRFVQSHGLLIALAIVLSPFVVLALVATDYHFSRDYNRQQWEQEAAASRTRAAETYAPPKISLVGLTDEEIMERYNVNDGGAVFHGATYVFNEGEQALLRVDDAY